MPSISCLRRTTEDILHAPEGKPILDVALSTTFVLLADDPGREVVIGTLIGPHLDRRPTADEFVSFDRPGVEANVQLRDGSDVAFVNFAPPLDTTVPQVFTFPPASVDRTATLGFGMLSLLPSSQ